MGPNLYKRGFDDDTEVLKARLSETTLLLEVLALVNALSSKGKSFQEFCIEVGKILKQKLKFKYIHIWIRDEKDPAMLQLVTPEIESGFRNASIFKGIVGKAIREMRTICLPDVFVDPDYINVRQETKSELCVPLVSDDNIIGVINIETDYYQTFESHISTIGIIARHLANFLKLAMLHQTEENFHSLVENMNEGVWVGDGDEKTIYTNFAFQKMTKYTAAEIKEKKSYDFFDEESRKKVDEENEKRRNGFSSQYEAILLSKMGEKIPVIVQGAPFGAGGTMATLTDLREIRSAEKKLARAEQFLASITQHCNEAIAGLSEGGVIQSWNVGAEKMFGYKAEEIVGKSINSIMPAENISQNEHEGLIQIIKKKGVVRNLETVRLHKNDKLINVCLSLSAIRDKNGAIIGFSALFRDITAQKKWEKELQDRFEKMQEAYREMGKQRRYLDYLVDIINMSSSTSYTEKQIATFVVNAMVMLARVDAATLRILDRSTEKLVLKAQSGVDEDWWNKKAVPYAGSLVEKAINRGQPLKILDILSDPRYDSPALASKNNLRSALIIPLETKAELIGSITLYLSNESNLSLLDDEFIGIFAKQAALAIKLAKKN